MNLTEKYLLRAKTNGNQSLNKKYTKTIDNIDKSLNRGAIHNSAVKICSKNLNKELRQDSRIEWVARKNKTLPLVEKNEQYKQQVTKELKKDICQRCLTRQCERLCWGDHADGRNGWGRFCLECEPYPYDIYPEMLRGREENPKFAAKHQEDKDKENEDNISV